MCLLGSMMIAWRDGGHIYPIQRDVKAMLKIPLYPSHRAVRFLWPRIARWILMQDNQIDDTKGKGIKTTQPGTALQQNTFSPDSALLSQSAFLTSLWTFFS
jgi:hypothetical protein